MSLNRFMKPPISRPISIALVSFALASTMNFPVRSAEYHSLKEITVGGAGGFDYLTVDPLDRPLYV